MTAMQSAPQTGSTRERTADEAKKLFEELCRKQSNASAAIIARVFSGDDIARIRDVLPDSLKDQAERFVKRAAMYFQKKDTEKDSRTAGCTMQSKLMAVAEAAEMGVSLDGKLAYAVPYGSEVRCQLSYMGLVVVARRTGEILDAYGDVVCANDHFRHGRKGKRSVLEHTYPLDGERGPMIGAYVVIVLPNNRWRSEVMQGPDLERIRKSSKQPDGPAWKNHPHEMHKKTVLRRGLKLYCSDPGTLRAIELDEQEFTDDGEWTGAAPASRVRRSALNDRGKTPAPPATDDPPAPGTSDPPPPDSSEPEQGSHDATDRTDDEGAAPGGEERQPGDDGEQPPDETPLSPLALELEAKLHAPGIDRKTNADILGQIMAAKLTEAERDHLKAIAKANTDRLKKK